MKNLENFIHMHRNEFDMYHPGTEVWAGIATGLTVPGPLSTLGRWFGAGSKNIILAVAATAVMLTAGIWAYQSHKTPQTNPAAVSQYPIAKETPAPESTKQVPLGGNETTHDNSGAKLPGKPLPQHIPLVSADAPGDSFYTGIKKMALKSFGYDFKIKRSDTKKTRVRILKPGTVKDRKTNAELVLKIDQKGSELVFEYEGQDKSSNYQTVTKGEIEILIPDDEISEITTISSNIDINGYTTPALSMLSTSGNINATGIKAKLTINSSSGKLNLADMTGDLKYKAASGKAMVKNLQGNIKIETTSGEIAISDSHGDVTCNNTSGNIRLDNIQGKLDINTISGKISGESVNLIQSCNIQTVSGNVDLGLQNSADELSFALNSISGPMKVKKGTIDLEGKKSLNDGKGKIKITGQTISGTQLYR